MRKTKLKQITFSLFLFLVVVVIMLFLAEIALRIFVPTVPRGFANYPNLNSTTTFQYKEKTRYVNSQGLVTSKEYKLGKNEDVYRILFVGDSFVFGGVNEDETITSYLENILNRNIKGEFEVLNSGVSGACIIGYTEYVKNYADKFKPDLVIIGFYAENDVMGFSLERDPILKFFKLKIVNLGYNRLIKPFRKSYRKIKKISDRHGGLGIAEINFGMKDPNLLQRNLLLRYEYSEKDLNYTRSLILQILNITRTNDADLFFVLIPSSAQIDRYYHNYRSEFGYNMTDEFLTNFTIQDRIIDILNESGIPYLDLLPEIKESENKLNLYYNYDMHFNKAGNMFSAELIYDFIVKNKMYEVDKKNVRK